MPHAFVVASSTLPHVQLEIVYQSAVQRVVVVAFIRATTGPKRPIRPLPLLVSVVPTARALSHQQIHMKQLSFDSSLILFFFC